MDFNNLKRRVNSAIDTREKGNLTRSRHLFESIIKDVNRLLRKNSSKELKDIYVTAMGEYIIQYRLEAGQICKKALQLGGELLKYDKLNDINNPLSVRAVSNTLLNQGQYEKAEEYLKQLLPLYEGNSAQIGDTKAHISYCYLRCGYLNEAYRLINQAIIDIKENSANKKHIPTWLSHAFLVKSLILNSQGNIKEAIKYANNALEIAEKGKVKARVDQSRGFIEYLNKRIKEKN